MERIAGLVCLKDCSEESQIRLVEAMCDMQAHGHAVDRKVVSLRQVCLAATRLLSADPSDNGCQPLQNEAGDVWIVYNGKLSNAPELREELVRRGRTFQSQTDAEIVLRAFAEWGEECFARLTGLFAFVIYDCHTEALTLVRDRFGMKSLYYAINNGHIYFASEMKPLIQQISPLHPNREALIEWFLHGVVLNAEELFQGIYTVPSGHFLKIHKGQVLSPCRYYSVMSEVDAALYQHLAKQPSAAVLTALANELDKGVQDCLNADVSVGTLCSGGVDSSLITALAARHTEITAFHVSTLDDPRMDEQRYAEAVASHLGLRLVCRAMDRETFLRNLPQAIYFNELPLTHIQAVAFYLGFKLAAEHGVKILLTGDGADSCLGGNWSRYGRQRQLFRLRRLFAGLPERLQRACESTVYAYNGMIVNATAVRRMNDVMPFLDRYLRKGPRIQCEEVYQFVDNAIDRSILATKLADLAAESLRWFFQQGDRYGMAEAVDYRAPFMEQRLIKLAVNLPWSYHTRGSTEKWGVKKIASQLLPHSIVYRKKEPWDLPAHQYLPLFARPEFFKDGFCLDVLGLHHKALTDISQSYNRFLPSLFNLTNLEIWGRLFFLHQPLEDLTEQIMQFAARSVSA